MNIKNLSFCCVIPAKAGIQCMVPILLDTRLRGYDKNPVDMLGVAHAHCS